MGSLFAAAGSIFSRYTGRSSQPTSTPPDSSSEDSSATAVNVNNQTSAGHDADTQISDSKESEEDSPETTPKASASSVPPPVLAVPILNLDSDASNNDKSDNTNLPPQSASETQGQNKSSKLSNGTPENKSQKPLMPPPPVPQIKQQPSSTTPSTNTPSLMPPPSVPRLRPTSTQSTNQLQPPRPGAGSALRPPPSAAAGLRAPPTSGGSRLSNSTLAPVPVKKSNNRKVVLEPGYSPLDWAALAANPKSQLRGANMPPGYLRVTPSMLKAQNGRKGRDAWTSYQGKVYNIQPYVPYHPGGKGELLRGAGKDSAKLFQEIHPWVNWDGILSECLVGILVSENDAQTEDALDQMD